MLTTRCNKKSSHLRGPLGSRLAVVLLAALLCASLAGGAHAVQLDIGDGAGIVGDTVVVAVTTSDLTGLGVYSYEFNISWTVNRAVLIGVEETGTITDPWGPVAANIQASQVDVAAAGAMPLTGSGTLVNLRFVLGPNPFSTNVNFNDLVFNEGAPLDTLSNGFLTVTAAPTIFVTPNTGELVVGDSLQFFTSSGTPPYVYASSDTGVADFTTGTQYLHGKSPGQVTVTSTDDNGTMDVTNGLIYVRAFELRVQNAGGEPGDTVLVPVTIGDPAPYGIKSAEFGITYTPTRLQAIGTDDTGTIAAAAGWQPSVSYITSGRIDISMAGANSLAGPGTLVYIRFVVVGTLTSTMTPLDGMFNETFPPVHHSGTFSVAIPNTITVTPNTATIVVGDNVGFTAVGGAIPPVTWGVTNGAVASIDASGNLTATASGQTRVFAVDNVGITDTTDVITICDLYLVVPDDTLGILPSFVSIDVDRDVTGLGIFGYEMTVTYNATKMMVTGVTSAGTVTSAWGNPIINTSTPGEIIIVAAGATEATGSGPLVYIQFQVLEYGFFVTNMNITNLLFNEGDPCALIVNGKISIPTSVRHDPGVPQLELEQNIPNPFNPTTSIGFTLPDPAHVRLSIFSASGRLVRRLLDRDYAVAGRYETSWDGTNESGARVASGIYLYRLDAGGAVVTKKMVLLK